MLEVRGINAFSLESATRTVNWRQGASAWKTGQGLGIASLKTSNTTTEWLLALSFATLYKRSKWKLSEGASIHSRICSRRNICCESQGVCNNMTVLIDIQFRSDLESLGYSSRAVHFFVGDCLLIEMIMTWWLNLGSKILWRNCRTCKTMNGILGKVKNKTWKFKQERCGNSQALLG